MFRSTLFWLHLISGLAVGLVVLMMSVTGVLLTYERQIIAWAERSSYSDPEPGAEPLALAELIEIAKLRRPDFAPTTITLVNEPGAPVVLAAGRGSGTFVIDPYTGTVSEPAAPAMRRFFAAVTGWHRWFNATGDSRTTARAITGAANLAFLFLVLSGLYLWLPRTRKWVAFKYHLLFNPQAGSGKARDFNWHHVFGFWSALPLAVVVATAVVFSYPWANDLVYRSVGEEPPRPGAPSGGGQAPATPSGPPTVQRSYDELVASAAAHGAWRTLTLNLPQNPAATTVRFTLDTGNGGQPQLRNTLVLDRATGAVEAFTPFASQSTGQKARSWIRFLHTGEALGIVGQTVAGLVSLTSVFMVWTGFALAWRRLVRPLVRRRVTAPVTV